MGIDINRLGPEAQKQALAKLLEQKAVKQSKYRNEKATRTMPNGEIRTFDGLREARRYDFLIERERRGEIRDLRLQVDFTLQEAYTDMEGHRVRAIRYRADFTYYEGKQEQRVVEDVKSKATKTQKYAIKKKMLKDRFGLDITEV